MDRLADYYMEMAEQTFPVLEVDAGRAVELIVNKGVSLRLQVFRRQTLLVHAELDGLHRVGRTR
jgi:hypothetical protein